MEVRVHAFYTLEGDIADQSAKAGCNLDSHPLVRIT